MTCPVLASCSSVYRSRLFALRLDMRVRISFFLGASEFFHDVLASKQLVGGSEHGKRASFRTAFASSEFYSSAIARPALLPRRDSHSIRNSPETCEAEAV